MKKLFITFSLFLLSSFAFGQLNENFSNGMPANWATFNTGTNPSPTKWRTINSTEFNCDGTTAFMNGIQNIGIGKTTENWMVTNLVNVPANGELRFFTKAAHYATQGVTFQVRISTSSQMNINSFATIKNLDGMWSLGLDCHELFVDLSGYAGQQVYIAFVLSITQPTSNANPERWMIDNVKVVERCEKPGFTRVVPESVLLNSTEFYWDNPGNATQWELQVVTTDGNPRHVTNHIANSIPFNVTGLLADRSYKAIVRAICTPDRHSEWVDTYMELKTGCPTPTGIHFELIGNSIVATWDNSPYTEWGTSWEVQIALSGEDFPAVGVIVNTNSHTFSVDPQKSYKVRVRAICDYQGQKYPGRYWNDKVCIGGFDIKQKNNFTDKDLCVNEPIFFKTKQNEGEILTYNWRIYDTNNNLITQSTQESFTFFFSQPGNYYCVMDLVTNICNESVRIDFEILQCAPKCFKGNISNVSNLCIGDKNYFWFTPDTINPIDFSDPNLSFTWHVKDSYGNNIPFQPIYLFGNLPYFINVPFVNDGNFSVLLEINGTNCKSRFLKEITVKKCNCAIKGEIGIKSDKKVCAGTKFDLYFSEGLPGFQYNWNIINSNYQSVYLNSSSESVVSPTIDSLGEYIALLTVRDKNGCESMFIYRFKVEDCGDRCISGNIANLSNICVNNNNYFWFVPNASNPIDYSDPFLNFVWSVTYSNGTEVQFEPIYLLGSAVATYIRVPFSDGSGDYTVSLTIETKKCKENFQKNVNVAKKCNCKLKGEIIVKDEKICAGKEFGLSFDNPQSGYTYNWNILNSQHQSIYSISSMEASVGITINQTGEFVALLTVIDPKGCESLFIYNFKSENCGNCLLGEINASSNLCAGGENFFWFVPDISTPIDYSDSSLVFEWTVTDSNGNNVPFEPVYLFESHLAYYIKVLFPGDGNFTIDLMVGNEKCKEYFKKVVTVAKSCNCGIKGKIAFKEDKFCTGQEFSLNFNNPQQGYYYNWNILNSSYQSIYSYSGANDQITTVINEEGIYSVLLTVTDPKGCQTLQILSLKIGKCGGNDGDCYTHLAFSFATPNSSSNPTINNAIRQSIAKGVVDFVNQNTNGKLFLTTIDDHDSGSRFAAKQVNITNTLDQPTINASNEILAESSVGNNSMLRIQNDDYVNTVAKNFNLLSNSQEINMPVDVNFVVISKDNTSSEIITSYNNLINSGKVKKVFFVFLGGGEYVLNGQSLSPQNFVGQIINLPPRDFAQTNSVLNSNYVIIPISGRMQSSIPDSLKTFFQNAYNQIKSNTVCDEDCLKGEIKNQDSLCAGADNAFWFAPVGTINYTDPQLHFSWVVTKNGISVPYETVNGSTAINLPNTLAGNYTITLVVSNSNCTKTYVKNITVRNCTVPSCGDATNQFQVIKLFKDLLEHLKNQPAGTITNGYACAELMSLQPYINPSIANPAIYNFSKSNNTLSFSFSPNASSPHVVFKMPANPNSITWPTLGNYVNMNNQTPFSSLFLTFTPFWPSSQLVSGSTVSQINFCPNELKCINHIAIVLDESTSITSVDAGRIRGQLKKFVEQQVIFNQTHGSQLRLTLIGLSDQDDDVRTDQITNMLVNAANKQTLINWINKYKTRYNQNLSGINSNSDYWNSGLYKAAQTNASLVILITDGAQTEDLNTLKTTIGLFNNAGNTSSPRHLHVIGLSEGYYVNGVAGTSSRYSNSFNPNLVADISDEDGEIELASTFDTSISSRLTDNLRISLRYLIYGNLNFPHHAEDENPFSKDYSGHVNFKFLYDDPYYISNGIYDFFGKTCGERQYLDKCDNCDGLQLGIGESYIISGWVHVDQTLQVTSFREEDSPSIEIVFSDEGEINLDHDTEENGITYKKRYEFFPQGNIIDGWQRIFGTFNVHPQTVYLEILLNNSSVKNAVHFDDIRIHPRSGSMKSFIYDDQNYRLMSELDENNYSTYYEYDAEGGLVRVKKETERGIKTIQETRSGSVIKPE